MKKIIISLFSILLLSNIANATSINKAIRQSGINKNAVSVSIKEVNSGKTVYELNSHKPMIPASTLKVVTYTAALNELGADYEFTTSLYKNTNNELFLKLGADPFLKSSDIRDLLRTAKNKNIYEPKKFNIDDSIIDNIEWGEGWQWDDDLNPLMPKFSSYNLDGNMLTAIIEPTQIGASAEIKLTEFYPVNFLNLVITDKDNKNIVELTRNNNIAPDLITATGTVNRRTEIKFPVNYTKRYFVIRLEEAIRKVKLGYYGQFTHAQLPHQNIYLVDQIKNPIAKATEQVMKNSNNLVAETVYKVAGGHYAKTTGSAKNGFEMLKNYCDKIQVKYDDVRIVDGSGVSKNNLVTADFMTSFLLAQDTTKDILMLPGEGTLTNRMLYFTDKLKAKTGTLSDVSAITGYLTTTSGKTYAFDIMINDAKSNPNEKKMLEEYILRALQTSY